MIQSIRYQNFKRYDDASLDLSKRLTVLVGPNSSGKSSLIKGLLAFKQTYADPADHAGFLAQGEFVDIGNFDEYVKDHNVRAKVTFVFAITPNAPFLLRNSSRPQVYIRVVHENDPQTNHGRVASYCIFAPSDSQFVTIDNFEECDYRITFKRMNKVDESFKINISKGLFDGLIERQRTFKSAGISFDQLGRYLGYGHYKGIRDNKRGMSIVTERQPNESYTQFMYWIERFFVSPIHSELFSQLTERTFALASLREKPARSVTRTDERQNVGPSGANTAAVYLYLRQRAVKAGKRASRNSETYQRLEDWFRRLKLGNEIEINSWRALIDMRTKTASSAVKSDSVVDIGVGFSQAAPILVQLAAMPDRSMLVMEQPELHLYPWSQTRLGEILCEEAARGAKNLVIETHSEHIIHGIQVHISKVRTGEAKGLTAKDVQIIYVSGNSRIQKIDLNDFGEFNGDWPDGFFDQTLQVYRTIMENRIK